MFIISIPFFSAMDVCAQTLVAAYLGAGDRRAARSVLLRILQLAVGLSIIVACVMLASMHALPALFTRDAAVTAAAAGALPVVAFFLPSDAAAAVLDGGLLGASETQWVWKSTIFVSAACAAALLGVRRAGGGLPAVWLAFKVLTVGRAVAAGVRFAMPGSPLGSGPLAGGGAGGGEGAGATGSLAGSGVEGGEAAGAAGALA